MLEKDKRLKKSVVCKFACGRDNSDCSNHLKNGGKLFFIIGSVYFFLFLFVLHAKSAKTNNIWKKLNDISF